MSSELDRPQSDVYSIRIGEHTVMLPDFVNPTEVVPLLSELKKQRSKRRIPGKNLTYLDNVYRAFMFGCDVTSLTALSDRFKHRSVPRKAASAGVSYFNSFLKDNNSSIRIKNFTVEKGHQAEVYYYFGRIEDAESEA